MSAKSLMLPYRLIYANVYKAATRTGLPLFKNTKSFGGWHEIIPWAWNRDYTIDTELRPIIMLLEEQAVPRNGDNDTISQRASLGCQTATNSSNWQILPQKKLDSIWNQLFNCISFVSFMNVIIPLCSGIANSYAVIWKVTFVFVAFKSVRWLTMYYLTNGTICLLAIGGC